MTTCNGKMENGPGKRFARCGRCRRIDYEANEGDRCKESKRDGTEEETAD